MVYENKIEKMYSKLSWEAREQSFTKLFEEYLKTGDKSVFGSLKLLIDTCPSEHLLNWSKFWEEQHKKCVGMLSDVILGYKIAHYIALVDLNMFYGFYLREKCWERNRIGETITDEEFNRIESAGNGMKEYRDLTIDVLKKNNLLNVEEEKEIRDEELPYNKLRNIIENKLNVVFNRSEYFSSPSL